MAAVYDRYPDVMNAHGGLIEKAENWRQEKILSLLQAELSAQTRPRVIEVGIGTGLFARACKRREWDYTGVDRSAKLISLLGDSFNCVNGECPPLPASIESNTYDLAYASFILEHLADGVEAFSFVSELKRVLKPGGLICLVVPDALSLGLEFWNLDYTHRYPTAERNVTQILQEAELDIRRVVRYRAAGFTGILYWLVRLCGLFYSYRFWTALLRRTDIPYSIYQYVKQDILVFICAKRNVNTQT
ncbi:MAG: class I SAM-dependent methyltransferase [Kiritimatiellia bacterium]